MHRQRQEEFWCRRDLAEAPGHPFYKKLDEVLEKAGFDEFCEAHCRQFDTKSWAARCLGGFSLHQGGKAVPPPSVVNRP